MFLFLSLVALASVVHSDSFTSCVRRFQAIDEDEEEHELRATGVPDPAERSMSISVDSCQSHQ